MLGQIDVFGKTKLEKRMEERAETDWKNGEEVMTWWTGQERRNNE